MLCFFSLMIYLLAAEVAASIGLLTSVEGAIGNSRLIPCNHDV